MGPAPETKVVLRFNKYRGTIVEFMVLENTSIQETTEPKWYKLCDFSSEETPILNKEIMDLLLGHYE